MSSAVSLERMTSYKMPAITAGTIVRYFPSGTRTARRPDIAQVKTVSERSVVLVLTWGQQIDTVRHVDDPKLTLNADQRENGAWDYTDEHYQRAAWEQSVEKRLSELESGIPEKTKPASKPSGGISKYQELRKRAKSAGVKFSGNPTKEWLETQLKEVSDAEGTSTGDAVPSMAGEGGAGEEG